MQYFDKYHSADGAYAALGGSLVLAAIFGALRSATVRLWIQDGQAWQKGNWLTGLLWAVALGAHLGYDALVAGGHGHGVPSVGDATVVLYLAVSLGIQRVIVQQRANRLIPGGGAAGPASRRSVSQGRTGTGRGQGAAVGPRCSHCPRPGSATTCPSSSTTSPRLSVNRGQP